MLNTIKCIKKARFLKAAILGLLIIFQAGCNNPEEIYTIGILSRSPSDREATELFDGLKEGIEEKGYIENKDVKYLVHEYYTVDDETIDAAINDIIAKGIDLLVTTGDNTALRAKKIVEGTDMPVIFSSSPWPEEAGLIESMKHPGGNMSGIRFADTTPKALELLKTVKPSLHKIFVPYCPKDSVSVSQLPILKQTASKMELELVIREASSVKEAVAQLENLPEDVDAMFMIISPTLNTGHLELSLAARKRGMLSGSIVQDDAVLLSLIPDLNDAGRKKAHVAHQILMGYWPGDLPVETPEVMLRVNLKTAELIGVTIPEVILARATVIVR